MMKMDGRSSAEYQNWEKRDIIGILGIVLVTKGQKKYSDLSSSKRKEEKNMGRGESLAQEAGSDLFRERESSFSLGL